MEETWLEALSGELRKPYALDLCRFVGHERMHGKVPVYPPPHLVFHALHTTPFHDVKAVIIGQVPNPVIHFFFARKSCLCSTLQYMLSLSFIGGTRHVCASFVME